MCDSIANGVRRGVLAGDIIQPFANLVVSNSVTTTNVTATGTLTVSGALTSNAANTTFFYDTFTIPYINTQVLNVASMIGITNVATLNVQSLFANSATIYGANTLNVLGISNLNSLVTPTANVETLNVIAISNLANLVVSNTVTTTNIVASGFTSNSTNTVFNFDTLTIPFVNSTTLNVSSTSNLLSVSAANVIIGSGLTTVQANLHIEKGSIFIGNSAVIGATTNTNSVTAGTLVFDNTANTSIIPNKILLFSNTAAPGLCGFGVNSSGGGQLYYHARSTHVFYLGNPNTNEVMRVTSGSTVGIGTASPSAKLHVSTSNPANVQVRIDSSNIALVSNGAGLVGFGTLTPTANLHVIGNVYASNALQTTNLFVTGNVATVASSIFQSFNFTVAATAGSYTNVCSIIDSPNGSGIYVIYADMMSRGAGGSAQTKAYIISCNFNATAGVWTRALPISNPSAGGQIGLDVMTLNGTTYLRATNRNAAEIVSVGMVIKTSSSTFSTVGITDLTAQTGTGATSTGFYPTTVLTQVAGRAGISIEQPTANLHVTGNIYASNALQTTTVSAATVSTTNPIPFRNRIINGGMTLWQRNTASITTTASLYTTADRWCGALGTSGLLLSQWPGPTEALQFPYSLQVTTSTTTTGVPLVEQRMEYLNVPDFLNGTAVSVSFYAGQPYGTLMPLTVGLYYATAVNNFGTQTLAVAATQNTPTLTAANVYYSLNFTLNTSLGATNGLALRFTTGGASAVGSTVLLTGVQVEKGAIATPFEVRPHMTELALTQRYYYQLTSPTAAVQGSGSVYSIFGTATGITTTAFWVPIQFPVPMRTPNYSFSNSAVSNFQLLPTGTTTITSVGLQTDSFTPVSATLNFVGTNITAGGSYIFRTNGLTGSNVAFFGFSCEL